MRRLLVVAGDRALTRFVAEAVVARPSDPASFGPLEPWEVSRAHSGLEAFLLTTRGGRPFDIFLIDQSLPDQPLLNLIGRLRRESLAKSVPIFVMTERGRDPHVRRVATDQHGVVGFIEKPVTEESLRSSLASLERRRRVLLVEPDPDLAEVYAIAFGRVGYIVEHVSRGRDCLDRAAKLRPDIAVMALHTEDMKASEVCVELKRSRAFGSVPVVLYGQASALASQEIDENAYRADDFVQSPFDEGLLVERVATLVGRAITISEPRPRLDSVPPPATKCAEPNPLETAPGGSSDTDPRHDRTAPARGREATTPLAPPASASPAPAGGPARRTTRRVPCRFTMSIRNGDRVYASQTLDISRGGIFLATNDELAVHEIIDMRFQLPDVDRVIEAVGRVAWRSSGSPQGGTAAGVGVKFSRIDPADLQLIVDYVNRVSKVVYSAS